MMQETTIECIKALSRIEGYTMSYEGMTRSHPLYEAIDLIMENLQHELHNTNAIIRAQTEVISTISAGTPS